MSTSEFVKNVGLAHKLLKAADAAGATPDDLNAMAENPRWMQQMVALHRGDESIKVQHSVNTNEKPNAREGIQHDAVIQSHRGHGKLMLPDKISYLSVSSALAYDYHTLEQLSRALRAQGKEQNESTALNATVAEYLAAHQYLIPDAVECRVKIIYFFGTTYRWRKQKLVRSLRRRHPTDPTVGRWYLASERLVGESIPDDAVTAMLKQLTYGR